MPEIEDKQQNDQDDSKYWKWGIFYYNPNDKRLLPPKRNPMFGWTVNFANPFSILLMIAIIAAIVYFFG
ncbi:DUF5808 domain-containing protein [Polluticoccus soli]|uniref:DUF5808 domain-containing protein n=1 Tax=Polluticoccus soli TaxID=3034150 RepID=UPI0023E30C04|nr:DUF5808 domain-containing protein [Flavipsychrobacter sp. JY13-12]